MLPTLRQLQYLRLLAEHGSFSRAADAAHVTQPTLSAGIAELERILGAPMVERARSGVILTAAGQEAVTRAGEILARAEDLVQLTRSAGQPLNGPFRLGVIPTVAPFILPKVLPLLRERYPKLALFLREDLTQRLITQLRGGGLDAALIALPYDTAGLETAEVAEDELMALLPANHRLAGDPAVSPHALEASGLILLEDGHCLRDHALAACSLDPPKLSDGGFAATSLHTIVQMVGSGLGVSLAPAMAVDGGLLHDAPVSVVPIEGRHAAREIVIAWRSGSSRRTEARLLAEAMREVAGAAARRPGASSLTGSAQRP